MLKAPGTKRLKLKYDEQRSTSADKFNMRRYNKEKDLVNQRLRSAEGEVRRRDQELASAKTAAAAATAAGAYTRPRLNAFCGIRGACRGCRGGV